MGIPSDDVVIIRPPERPGEPSLITISCPDKTGLGCDLCRVILLFGLNIVRGDFSTDGRWCYVLFWVVERGRKATRWALLKKWLIAACPPASSPCHGGVVRVGAYNQEGEGIDNSGWESRGPLLSYGHQVPYISNIIQKVSLSYTITDNYGDDFRELLHTKNRKDEACTQLRAVLGDSMCSCDIELASAELADCLQASSSLPPSVTEDMITLEFQEEPSSSLPRSSVSMDNSLSHAHSLIQIQCHDHKGLLYDIMKTLKDYNIQVINEK
ncbi:hypothetical protein BHM03_00008627 [Ensete ventricosum]|nr:hypothetical protein BHM03_00008627 [Ensete ventricosum]